jgi:hypothetical protein
MLRPFHLPWWWVLASALVISGSWDFGELSVRAEEVQIHAGVHGDRLRIMLGFQVKSEAVQRELPAPWQLGPPASGPDKGANLFVILVDRVRDDEAEEKPSFSGANRIINLAVPARHRQTGQIASVILGGWASNPANVPGFYQVYRAATVHVERAIKDQPGEAEEVTDVWEVHDAAGHGSLELRLQSRRKMVARRTVRGEAQVVSAKDPALWQLHKFDAAAEVVKSVPAGINKVEGYSFRLSAPEYGTLFDGSEQLISIRVTPWYVRQVFVR